MAFSRRLVAGASARGLVGSAARPDVRGLVSLARSVTAARPALAAAPAPAVAAPWGLGGVRWKTNKAGTPRHVRNKLRRGMWKEIRQALAWSTQFDPHRHAEKTLAQSFDKCGWPVVENEPISEDLTVRFALRDKYLAFELCAPEEYFPGTEVLRTEVQARHLAIRRKGWKLIAINRRAWEKLLDVPHGQHEARRDFLIRLILREAPFQERRVVEAAGGGGGGGSA